MRKKIYNRTSRLLSIVLNTLARDYAGDDLDFTAWLKKVDALVEQKTGLSFLDLEDWSWRDAYDSGDRPFSAVEAFLSDLGLTEE